MKNQQSGVAARNRKQHEHRGEGRHDCRNRKRVGSRIGKTKCDHQHRAECRRLRRTEQRRRRQRIAQQPLQCRSGQPENRTDREPQDSAGQPDFAHDHLLHIAAAAEQRVDHGQRRQPYRPDPERHQRQQHHEHNKSSHHACAPARSNVSRHGDALNAHPLSSIGCAGTGKHCDRTHAGKKTRSSSQDTGSRRDVLIESRFETVRDRRGRPDVHQDCRFGEKKGAFPAGFRPKLPSASRCVVVLDMQAIARRCAPVSFEAPDG